MKINTLVLAAAAVISVSITAVEAAPIVRDHRTPSAANCPGGTVVNGQCAQTLKRPRCVPNKYYPWKCYYRR
jgi:hypothetical protein